MSHLPSDCDVFGVSLEDDDSYNHPPLKIVKNLICKEESTWRTPSYDMIHKVCVDMVSKMNLQSDTLLVGVARGGLFPALIISHLTGLPLATIHYSSNSGNGDDKKNTNIGRLPNLPSNKILLIDDLSDSGNTLNDLKTHYESIGRKVETAVVLYKETTNGKHIPTYYGVKVPEDFGWITFPYEQG